MVKKTTVSFCLVLLLSLTVAAAFVFPAESLGTEDDSSCNCPEL